jgi:hypothetical protein
MRARRRRRHGGLALRVERESALPSAASINLSSSASEKAPQARSISRPSKEGRPSVGGSRRRPEISQGCRGTAENRTNTTSTAAQTRIISRPRRGRINVFSIGAWARRRQEVPTSSQEHDLAGQDSLSRGQTVPLAMGPLSESLERLLAIGGVVGEALFERSEGAV